LENTTLK